MSKKLIKAGNALAECHWQSLLFISLLVVLLRWSFFYHSVIDWDESLYLLVADKWLDGHLPYTVIWDNKPPGIYILFSIALSVLGRAVFSIRILACVSVIITCYLLYLISVTIYPRKKEIGLIASLFYATISTTCGGMSANTEIFFIPFSVAAFYLLVKVEHVKGYWIQDYRMFFWIGLLLGMAFEIKQVAIFDLLAMVFILGGSIIAFQARQRWVTFAIASLLLLLGFILPFLLISLYFFVAGNFYNYWDATFIANGLRIVDQTFSSSLLSRLSKTVSGIYPILLLSLCSFPLLLQFCLSKQINLKAKLFTYSLVVWFLSDFLGIILIFQRLYSHYFLPLSPIVSLAAAVAIRPDFITYKAAKYKKRFLLPRILIIALIGCLVTADIYSGLKEAFFYHVKGIKHWDDTPAQVSEYIRARISKNSYIYVVDSQPIIYFLTKASIPTRYAFPSFLIHDPDLADVTTITGIEPIEELHKIMSKKPVYIIAKRFQKKDTLLRNRSFYNSLKQYLTYYRLENTVNLVNLYKLKNY